MRRELHMHQFITFFTTAATCVQSCVENSYASVPPYALGAVPREERFRRYSEETVRQESIL